MEVFQRQIRIGWRNVESGCCSNSDIVPHRNHFAYQSLRNQGGAEHNESVLRGEVLIIDSPQP